jgi:sphinganine C4-monooxygenase
VPYAYGALYNHPVEGFALDTLGTGVAYLLTGMTVRQSMWFFTMSTIKTVDDHCGYALPWDPLQHITSNNAAYHDIHHQSWGIKSNFSQPFFTFWDRVLNTMWRDGDVKLRYEKSRAAAEAWWEEQKKHAEATGQSNGKANGHANGKAKGGSAASSSSAVDEAKPPPAKLRQSPRKKTTSSAAAQAGSLKGLTERVSGSLPNGVPRVDSTR